MVELRDIVGQPAALEPLARILASPRRPHAFMFAGPEGVGRRTSALALAKVLLCPNASAGEGSALFDAPGEPAAAPPLPAACRVCPSCRAFDAGTHPDCHVVEKTSARYSSDASVRDRKMQDLSIGVIREFLIDAANRRSGLGQGKVFIVREAELMSVPAQNALLKTLEEPPPGVTIVLLTTSPAEMLPTTRSRCAVLRFGPLPEAFVVEKLRTAGVAEPEARFWAAYTGGSAGVALRLAAQGLYAMKCELVDRLAALTQSVDPELGEWLARQADTLAEAVTREDKQLAASLATRQGTGTLLGLIAGIYRDAMALAAGAEQGLVHDDQRGQIERVAAALGLDRTVEIVDQLARFEQLVWRNVNPKVVWDNVVITCATGAPLDV